MLHQISLEFFYAIVKIPIKVQIPFYIHLKLGNIKDKEDSLSYL